MTLLPVPPSRVPLDVEDLRAGEQYDRTQATDGGARSRRAADPDPIRALSAQERGKCFSCQDLAQGRQGGAGRPKVHPHHADVRAGEAAVKVHTVGAAGHQSFDLLKAGETHRICLAGEG
jgi:hypothetical protein